jgi:23S rRNA pseudouridine1911/1915/1917 synthase
MSSTARSGRHAVTHWRVVQSFPAERLCLLELTLETGRTHQIRVHLSEQQLPIVGDPVYGQRGRANNIADAGLRSRINALQRQALHARLLGFIHPAEERYLEFESPLPTDMAAILDYLIEKYRGA